jgi:hypothetical protein
MISNKNDSNEASAYISNDDGIDHGNTALPTYLELHRKLEEYIRDPSKPNDMRFTVFQGQAEYNDCTHDLMMIIAGKLTAIKADFHQEEFAVPDDDQKVIFDIGCDIHRIGGKTAQEACYYIVLNFVDSGRKTKVIEQLWNGAGDWRY